MRKLHAILWLTSIMLLAGGCLNTHRGLEGRGGDRRVVNQVKDSDVEFFPQWRRVTMGFKPKDELVGYLRSLKTRKKGGVIKEVHWVYNLNFQKVAFFTEVGVTYRRNKAGEYSRLGVFSPEQTLMICFKNDGPVNFFKMPRPKGLAPAAEAKGPKPAKP